MSYSFASNNWLPLTPQKNVTVITPLRRLGERSLENYGGWKRRRLKCRAVHNHLFVSPSPFEALFQKLITQFPSVNSLDSIAPALGFATGVAIYLLRSREQSGISGVSERFFYIGEWNLLTSPTPFYCFVMLRCCLLSFQGSKRSTVWTGGWWRRRSIWWGSIVAEYMQNVAKRLMMINWFTKDCV